MLPHASKMVAKYPINFFINILICTVILGFILNISLSHNLCKLSNNLGVFQRKSANIAASAIIFCVTAYDSTTKCYRKTERNINSFSQSRSILMRLIYNSFQLIEFSKIKFIPGISFKFTCVLEFTVVFNIWGLFVIMLHVPHFCFKMQ